MTLFKQKSKGFPYFAVICFVALFAYAVSLVYPLIWSIIASLKTNYDYIYNCVGLPMEGWQFGNYLTVINNFIASAKDPVTHIKYNVWIDVMLINSLWYAVGTSLVSTLVSFVVAYVVARFRFKFCSIIYTVIIFQMIIPTVGTMPSELRIAQGLGVYNTVYGMLFMKSYVTGLYFLSFYGALRVIPKDYEEAAYLDGAGTFRVLINVIFPMATGVFSTVLLLNFIAFWNDYQTPLIYMPSYPTLAYGLWYYCNHSYNEYTSSMPIQLGGCMLMAIPLFVLFIIFQKKLLGKVSLGGLK